MDPITAYRAYWHAESNSGRLYLQLADDPKRSVHIDVDSAAELNAMVDLLRHNASMSYDPESKAISTAWRKPGA